MVCKHNLGRDQYIVRASQVVLVVKNLRASVGDARDMDLTPGLGRSPGGRNGNPLQYSYLGNPIDKEPGRLWAMGSQRDRKSVV